MRLQMTVFSSLALILFLPHASSGQRPLRPSSLSVTEGCGVTNLAVASGFAEAAGCTSVYVEETFWRLLVEVASVQGSFTEEVIVLVKGPFFPK